MIMEARGKDADEMKREGWMSEMGSEESGSAIDSEWMIRDVAMSYDATR